jgi:hypothetical protein
MLPEEWDSRAHAVEKATEINVERFVPNVIGQDIESTVRNASAPSGIVDEHLEANRSDRDYGVYCEPRRRRESRQRRLSLCKRATATKLGGFRSGDG